jgi:hypothetical protein
MSKSLAREGANATLTGAEAGGLKRARRASNGMYPLLFRRCFAIALILHKQDMYFN